MANKIKKMMNNGTAYTVGGIESSNDTYENIIHLSQEEYDALETKDPDTMYSTPEEGEGGELFNPENTGEEGLILTKTATGYAWCGAPGPKYGCVDILLIGGGGNGTNYGGGGAGGFVECFSYPIVIGTCLKASAGGTGGDSCFGDLTAYRGGNAQGNGASGGGAGSGGWTTRGTAIYGNQGCDGGYGTYQGCHGGGGGAGGVGGCGTKSKSGDGGIGKCSCMSGELQWYSGGGGGASGSTYSSGGGGDGGCGGGGNGCSGCCNATYYGGGGGGDPLTSTPGGRGYQGVIYIRYKTDGSCGIHNALGGNKYTCGEYTIHEITDTSGQGYFFPMS